MHFLFGEHNRNICLYLFVLIAIVVAVIIVVNDF